MLGVLSFSRHVKTFQYSICICYIRALALGDVVADLGDKAQEASAHMCLHRITNSHAFIKHQNNLGFAKTPGKNQTSSQNDGLRIYIVGNKK